MKDEGEPNKYAMAVEQSEAVVRQKKAKEAQELQIEQTMRRMRAFEQNE